MVTGKSKENNIKNKIYVLIVDDRPENLYSLEQLLKDERLILVKAGSGEEALSKVLDYEFSLILMDVQMPFMDGFETAELLRGMEKTRYIPIIFITANSKDEEFIFKGYEAGAVDYIYKPINNSIIKSKIKVFVELFRQKKLYQSLAFELQDKIKELHKVQKELEEANTLLEHLSSHDGLTGIPNRRSFDHMLDREWRRCRRDEANLSIVMIDIDFFKRYNDMYGHIAGDNCLRQIGKAVSQSVRRPGDFGARYGGEEFVLILPSTDEEGAKQVSQKLLSKIEDLKIIHEKSDVSPYVTVSIGICSFTPCGDISMEEAINSADSALYRAKEEGRNRVFFQRISPENK